MARKANPESRERVLHTAERLFQQRGYQSVSMRDIARELGIKQASLYYHVPNGKEQLYVEVMTRNFVRHGEGILGCIDSAEPNLRAQLKAVAGWFIESAPMGLLGMLQSDLNEIKGESRQQLEHTMFEHIWFPIQGVIENAEQRGEIVNAWSWEIVGAFLSWMDGLTHAGNQGHLPHGMRNSADYMIDLLMDGMLQKTAAPA